MAEKKSATSPADVSMRKTLEALHGAAPSKKETKRVTDELHAIFRREVEQQKARRDEARALVRPIVEAIAGGYAEETAKIRKRFEELARQNKAAKLVNTPSFESGLMSGSIIALFAPPYDDGNQNKVGSMEAWGRADIGEIHVLGQEIGEGSGSASAQIGKWFRPVVNGLVRFRAGLNYSYSWWDSSTFYTAHNRGFIGAFIFENTNGENKLIVDNRVELWNDGTGWLESHNGSQDDAHEYFDIPFFASTRSSYFLGIWCGCAIDADDGFGGFSAASADFTGRVPLIVMKTGT